MEETAKSDLIALLRQDGVRWQALGIVGAQELPSGCIGAGFIRNLVWDHLHGRSSDCRNEDVDVLWYDPSNTEPSHDRLIEDELRTLLPELKWSVRNQARMHLRNRDAPYSSVEEAMRSWPETATAVAAKRDGECCAIIAPFGLDDLFSMILRPTSARPNKLKAFEARVGKKGWLSRWPHVSLAR
ncbi:MAG: nucleotidyltransferase family protein [Pseudomonadota bacterium]